MPDQDDRALDAYLRDAKTKKAPKNKHVEKQKKAPGPITTFQRWKAAAAMDIITIVLALTVFTVIGAITLTVNTTVAIYILAGAGIVLIIGIIYCLIDFHHFKTWTTRLHFKLEGWHEALNNRSRNYWQNDGEYWIPTRIVVEMAETSTQKHAQVTQVFLARLRKRLNQWTVSSEKHVGYSQPTGWSMLDLTLAGDMNARVLNLVRKRLSGEFNPLAKKMSGSITKVTITSSGKEERHEVYHDTSD